MRKIKSILSRIWAIKAFDGGIEDQHINLMAKGGTFNRNDFELLKND